MAAELMADRAEVTAVPAHRLCRTRPSRFFEGAGEVLGYLAGSPADVPDEAPDIFPKLRELPRPKNNESDHKDQNKFGQSNIRQHGNLRDAAPFVKLRTSVAPTS